MPLRAALPLLRSMALLLLAAAAMGGLAGCPAECPMGQRRVCRDARNTDCRCGLSCTTDDGCMGNDECFRFTSMPDAPGVCADRMWLFGVSPPCVPVCRGTERCIDFGGSDGNTCARACTRNTDCVSGCCLPLRDGSGRICTPTRDFCANTCATPCAMNELCVVGFGSTPSCATRCDSDADCPGSCCSELSNGAAVCAPNGTFCPTMPPPPCTVLGDCAQVRTQFTPAPEATCGTVGSYEGALGNFCGMTIHCRACWWSPAANAYADCVNLPELPNNATAPLDIARCANASFPDPPVRVRCVDDASYRSGFDCLGMGTM